MILDYMAPRAVPARVVLSDLDDTLFDHDAATRAALACVAAGEPALAVWPAAELDRRHRELLERLHLDVMTGRVAVHDARVERFRCLLIDACGRDDLGRAAAIAQTYRAAYEAAWQPVTGALELLRQLKTVGRAVVVVTNNGVAEQEQKLGRLGLRPYVDALVASEAVGCCKPEPEIFRRALACAGAGCGEAVMLGDAWAADIEGARRAGIRAVWLNRFGQSSPDPSVPELRTLAPVAEAMRLIVRGSPDISG
jgi:putative hydrolase of the HAD superfamily